MKSAEESSKPLLPESTEFANKLGKLFLEWYDSGRTFASIVDEIASLITARDAEHAQRIAQLEMERAKDASTIVALNTQIAEHAQSWRCFHCDELFTESAEREQAPTKSDSERCAMQGHKIVQASCMCGIRKGADVLAQREQAAVAAALREAARKCEENADACHIIGKSSIQNEDAKAHHRADAATIRGMMTPAQQSALDKMLAEAKREGAQEMRERAAKAAEKFKHFATDWNGSVIEVTRHDVNLVAADIRALKTTLEEELQK